MTDTKPQQKRGWAEVGTSGTDGVGNLFKQTSAGTAAMHLDVGTGHLDTDTSTHAIAFVGHGVWEACVVPFSFPNPCFHGAF